MQQVRIIKRGAVAPPPAQPETPAQVERQQILIVKSWIAEARRRQESERQTALSFWRKGDSF